MTFTFSQPEFQVTDQNQALPAQGSDAHQQGEQSTNNNNQTMESLLNEQDLNVDLPQSGEIRTGVIASISPSQILVSIGAKSEGVVSGRELEQLTAEEREALKIGQPITVRVIEVDRERRRLILSERAASTESRQSIKERVIEELEEGKVYTGRVTSLANFGAFININGADGLVHLSELSWDHIDHPREVLEVGQEVKVKVINVDKEKKRIGLSVRALQSDPWRARVEKYSVGQLVEGVITRLTKFGAFARLEGDIEGLIHISEISDHRIEHPKEVLKEGEVKSLRVIRIDPQQHSIGLSLRKVDSAAFADKDFKMLTAEYNAEEEAEESQPPEPSEDAPGESTSGEPEA